MGTEQGEWGRETRELLLLQDKAKSKLGESWPSWNTQKEAGKEAGGGGGITSVKEKVENEHRLVSLSDVQVDTEPACLFNVNVFLQF